MKKITKYMSALLSATFICGAVAGCASKDNGESTQTSSNSDMPFDGVTLHYAVTESATQNGEVNDLVKLIKEKTGINVEFTIVPTTNAGEVDKTLVSLMSGDELDIVYGSEAVLKTYYNAGVLNPLDELAENADYNMSSVFGDNLVSYNDNRVYALPAYNDIWITFYNKKIFDEAGIEYPSAEGWTWEKYIETAQKLTDANKGVFGSFMLDYDNYNYMYAFQHGWDAYKDSQKESNFDDPRFKESLEWFYSLGNDKKIQPDSITYASGAYPWNTFVASDKMGMFVCGSWAASLLQNSDKYPRDWKCGILPMPYPEGEEPSTLAVSGCYAVPVTSKNKEAAFAAIRCMAEEQYTLGYGRVPARVDLSEEEVIKYIDEKLVPAFSADGITLDDFKNAWFDKSRKFIPEKLIGPADATINKIIIEEAQLYGAGSKSIDDTVKSIKSRSDSAIKEELEQ